jgi:hypothetical protein
MFSGFARRTRDCTLDLHERARYSVAVMRTADLTGVASEFISTHRKIVQAVVLLSIALCLLDHVIEGLIGWDQQLWQTGRDTETTLFLVFLLLGLAFALVKVIHAFAKLFRRTEGLLALLQVEIPAPPFELAIPPDSSPPLSLRI